MIRIVATICLVLLGSWSAAAQTFPTQQIRFIVGAAPGGGADISARVIATRMTENIGRQVIVENRPGGTVGSLAIQTVMQSKPDGHTLVLATSGPILTSPHMYKTPYDPLKDLAPVALCAWGMVAFAVAPDAGVSSMQELIARSKGVSGGMSFSSPGPGTSMHLAGELLKSMTGAQLVPVHYKGTGPAGMALVQGEVPIAIADLTSLTPHHQAGRIRILAVANSRRSTVVADIPTVAEAGVAGYAADAWNGFFAPAGTPQTIVDQLNVEINKALAAPDVRATLTTAGLEAAGLTTAEFARIIETEYNKWGRIVRDANLKIE